MACADRQDRSPRIHLQALGLERVKRTVLDAVRESVERPSQQAAFTARLLGGSVYIDHADLSESV